MEDIDTNSNEPLDIGELMQMNFDDIVRPPALPKGLYHGVIENYEFTRGRFASKVEQGEKERVCRFRIKLDRPTEEMAPYVNGQVAGKVFSWDVAVERAPHTSKKTGGWRLKNALRGLGINVEGRLVSDALSEVTALPCLVEINKTVSSKDANIEYNDVISATAEAG
jgi:hypothetical protein